MDRDVFEWINGLTTRTTWANGIVTAYANAGIVLFAVLLLAGYLKGRQERDIDAVAGVIWAGAAALIGLGLAQIVGGAVNRARPIATLPNVHLLVSRTSDFSLPSDHSTVAGAVAVGLIFVNRRLGALAAAAALLMAFARVYVGTHYPADVITGLALGGIVAALGAWFVVPLLARLGTRLETTPVAPLIRRRPPAENTTL